MVLLRALSVCQNWPLNRLVRKRECTNLENKFSPSYLNRFKIGGTSFGVIIFQDVSPPFLENDAFDLQIDRSGRPVLRNGKRL